jgi:diaminopimelate decarboxylase
VRTDDLHSPWQASTTGELLIGDLPVSEIAERYGTPLFIYDRNVIAKQYQHLRETLPERFSICYSVKANPNPFILSFFLSQGCGLEIASTGEFFQASIAGCAPEDMLWAGPGKSESDLEFAVARSVGEIHAESALEVERISRISRRLGLQARVALRINPAADGAGGAMRMGGKSAPFGIDEEHADTLVRRIVDDDPLKFCGLHFFAGTQILDHNILLVQYRKALTVAKQIAAITGCVLETIDFGGGWGVPYFSSERPLDLTALKAGLRQLVEEIEGERCFAGSKFVVELGRFLVAEAGLYVARVTDIKISRGTKYLIVDGGMNHHLAASGNLGQVIKRNFPLAVINRMQSTETETVDIVGPLCTPLDTLGRSVHVGCATVGDLIGVFKSGAYCRSASPMGFLSHPTPPEILVEDNQDTLIRRRGIADDLVRDIQFLHTSHTTA